MKLEAVTAEIRPRGRWESIDLGCALVRKNYGKVMLAWAVTVLPMWLGIIFLSELWPWPEGRPWIALLACWLTLPICDRVVLYVVSRALFGESVKMSSLLKECPKMLFRRFFRTVVFGRFSSSRGLSQPVAELEGLKGKAYSSRVNLLSRNGGEGATQAVLIGWILILATMFSLCFVYLSFFGLFGDNVVIEDFWMKHVLDSDADFIPVPYAWGFVSLYLFSVTLIEPFFVGAGFAMYVNSRTVTEGWDIELAFKRMSERVSNKLAEAGKSVASLIICFFVVSTGFVETVSAEDEAAKIRVEQVMKSDDFVIHSETYKIPKREQNNNESKERRQMDFGALSMIGNLLFWLVVVAAVAGIVWLVYANRHLFSSRGRSGGALSTISKVKTVAGMDVRLESLPDDVVKAARVAWDKGERQLALSLLYRGAIAWLVHSGGVMIGEGDTEMDCERSVTGANVGDVAKRFSELTQMWVRLAYGKMEPKDGDFLSLCNAWPFKGARVEREDVA